MFKSRIPIYILLILVAFFSTGCTLKNPLTKNTVENEETEVSDTDLGREETENSSAIGSLNDLLALNKPQKCTWEQTIGDKTISATIYINGKSFKQELPMGEAGTFYGMSDGTSFYSWSDKTPNGVKMNMSEANKTAEDLKKDNPTLGESAVDLNKNYNFKCVNWTVDASKFVVPTDISFVDLADFTKDLGNMMKNIDLSKLKELGDSN
jgi:hypothetical protein